MTNATTIPVNVVVSEMDDIQITLDEKEKKLRKVKEEVRMYERLRIFFNSTEINQKLYEKHREEEKLEADCRELRRKML